MDLYGSSSWTHFKALRYGTRSQGISQFYRTPYVHPLTEWTIPAFAFPAVAGTYLPTSEEWKADISHFDTSRNDFITIDWWHMCHLRCTAIWGRPTPSQSFSTVTADARAKFEVRQPISCCLIAFLMLIPYFTLWSCTLTLWIWPLTVNISSLSPVTWWNSVTLCQIWAKSNNPRRSYCDMNIWPYDLEHVSRVPLWSGIIFTKFKLSQPIRS